MEALPDNLEAVGTAERWRLRAARMQLAHYKAARRFDARHLWLGVPAIVLSSIVGTTIFASLSKETGPNLKIFFGLLSVSAAVLTALQTFMKYADLSDKHRVAGAKFANIKHRLELVRVDDPSVDWRQQLTVVEDRWAKVREESPNIPTDIWSNTEKVLGINGDAGN